MQCKLPLRCFVLFLLVALLAPAGATAQASPARAQAHNLNSPVGRWKTIDDHTGQAKSIVAIREWHGELYGTIKKIFNPPVPHPLCIRCSGTFKNKPVLGLQILWGMTKSGNRWSGGYILDPEIGNIYRCTISLQHSGKVLKVHGYIGLPIFGRTEHWLRVQTDQR